MINESSGRQSFNSKPGFFRPGLSNYSTIQTLLGDFINDRTSDSLIKDLHENKIEQFSNSILKEDGNYKKIITKNDHLIEVINNPTLYKNSICILEPADHVGTNLLGEDVRASNNISFLTQYIADCDSILIPLWRSEELDNKLLMELLINCFAYVIEGGHPTLKDPKSFSNLNINLYQLQEMTDQMILSRGLKTAPAIFICLGHQLAAQSHIRLIKKAVNEIKNNSKTNLLNSMYFYKNLVNVCDKIIYTGENLSIYKNQQEVAKGWDDPCFAVALNEEPEVGKVELLHYSHEGEHPNKEFLKLLIHHELTSHQDIGIVEQSITYEKDLNIVMFHSDEVNEEAILFANWSYGQLHKALTPLRKQISVSNMSWLLKLPTSIEIVCSTSSQDKICTEVAATCINYRDYETHHVRRSFSFQFHPELLDDLREFKNSVLPTYKKLKLDDGIRMLVRVIYESITD